MPAIRATRDEVSDRFPVLGFTVQTSGIPYFEVMLTTDPDLPKEKRSPQNFYSTRLTGPLVAERGEAVFLAPSEVVQRFREGGAEKLFYGLATFPDSARSRVEFLRVPSGQSPYVNLRSYSGRSSRRMPMSATLRGGRRPGGNGYSGTAADELTWAGDQARPGMETIAPATATPKNGSSPGDSVLHSNGQSPPAQSAALKYDDGFGPMPTPVSGLRHASVLGGATVVDIASAITGATMSRVLDNVGDISWELDQLRGLKHPHDNPGEAGDAAYNSKTIAVTGPQIENLLTDQISADFEIRFQYNGHSLGNVEITNTGTNDALGWGLQVKANIMNDANVYDGRAAINVRFYYRFTRTVGSDQIGIYDLKVYADGRYEQNFRWTQSSSFAQGQGQLRRPDAAPVRAQVAPAVIPIASAIVGAVMTRILNNQGDVNWELDQLQGLKHPHDNPGEAGDAAYNSKTIAVTGPQIENLLTDQISADFEIRFQYNGHSLGNVEITNTGTNDALGWGLQVKANIMNDANVYDGRAAINVRFYYRFTRTVGSDQIGIYDLKVYADGRYEQNFRWTQSSSFAQGQGQLRRPDAAPVRAQVAPAVIPIASAIVGAVMTRILNNQGDVNWELDQLQGLKHPHDNPGEAGDAAYNSKTIAVTGPQIENLLTDQISADFEIRFQYNGHSLGNVEITNTGTNDALGWGLQVKANIMNDANVYDGRAAINVRFYYRFTRTVGSDQIGIYDLKVYADGRYEQNFRWTQSSSFAQGQGQLRRPDAAPVRAQVAPAVIPIASAIVGAVMTRILNNQGDVNWELDQLQGLKHPHDNPGEAGDAAYNSKTIAVTGPQIENLLTDQISADFEIRFQYNGHSLGNVEITNTGTNDALGWGLQVKANIMNDANVYDGRAAINVRFYYRFTRTVGSDQIGIYDLKVYADGRYEQNFRWTQSSSFAQGQGQLRRPDAAPVRAQVAPAKSRKDSGNGGRPALVPQARQLQAVEIATAIVGAAMTRILDNAGDVSWELDQLQGLKHPGNEPANAGGAAYSTRTINIRGPRWTSVFGQDEIYADCELTFQHNGRSLGNIQVTVPRTNDALGWGLTLKEQVMDEANAFTRPPSTERFAAVKVRFHYRFTSPLHDDAIAITDVTLYGDGAFDQRFRWTQS